MVTFDFMVILRFWA